jgi:phenol 2-monooxygenase
MQYTSPTLQFHENGYEVQDPRIKPARGYGLNRNPGAAERPDLPAELDVLIIGEGPAGMTTAAQLSAFPDLNVRLVEKRPSMLLVGQADGIQARSVETFQAFGFGSRIVEESYRITEMAFWKPDPANPKNIMRTAIAPDDPAEISEFPHIIINQARVMQYFGDFMRNGPSKLVPDYGIEYVSYKLDEAHEYPVEVTLRRDGKEFTVRTKYLVGADGARSQIRRDIGATRLGKQALHAWGVMDTLSISDFPDLRTKCAIQSSAGSILLIPREGGQLTRMYVDLGDQDENDAGAVRQTNIKQIIQYANNILHPYKLDVKDVAWHSVYEVGHRVTDRFDDVPADEVGKRNPRVFILGDACHTHSAKAGQGMNVSIQDGFNLAWKLGQVLMGVAPPSLLATYTGERQVIAQNLIDFDMQWSSLMAAKPEDFESPTELEDFYVRTAEFPAGFMTEYKAGLLTGTTEHQALAKGYTVGKRFKSTLVARRSDGNPVHLGHTALADGKYRIYVFADPPKAGQPSKAADLARWLQEDAASPVRGRQHWFDVKVIYQQRHNDFELLDAPEVFRPAYGKFGLMQYDRVFGVHPKVDIFEERGLSRDGVVVVVRPDQYVAQVLPLTATKELGEYFAGVMPRGLAEKTAKAANGSNGTVNGSG